MKPRLLASLACLATLPLSLRAQVGHPPDQSPYRDVNLSARVAVYTGWYMGAKDEAGVLPRNGPLMGLRIDAHIGGPADIAVRFARVGTTRNVIDPTRAKEDRIVESKNLSLAFADVGMAFNLTGRKSWHSLMPALIGSVGIVSDFNGADVGGFSHGSTFALGYGLGVRYVPVNRRLGMRMDLGSYMYSLQYPNSYYAIGGDGTAVLPGTVQRAQWRNNWTMSLGATYQMSR